MALKLALTKKERIERANKKRWELGGLNLLDEHGREIPGSARPRDSPVTDDRPVSKAPVARPPERPVTHERPVADDRPKPEAVKDYRRGDSRINNDFMDDRLAGHPPLIQALYMHLNRYRAGGSNLTIVLTWGKLMGRLAVSESTVKRAFRQLNKLGLVFKERNVYGHVGAQGIIFRVVTGDRAVVDGRAVTDDPHKRKALIKDNVKESYTPTAEEIETYERATGRKWGE